MQQSLHVLDGGGEGQRPNAGRVAIEGHHVGAPCGAIAKDELLLKAAKLGAVEVIMKPFEFRQLAGAVSRALGE